MPRRFVGAALLTASAAASADSRPDLAPSLDEQASAIVGGENVPPGMWPDTVAVLGASGSCTGTLIAPDVVLTAGHCSKVSPSQIIAATTDYAAADGVRVKVATTIAYPNWETTYDVAVLALASSVTGVTPRKVGTACTFGAFAPHTNVRLVGFGATNQQGTARNTVLKQAMTAVTDPDCSGGHGCEENIAPGGEFVAGGTGTGDSCFGDSGGPVYLDTEDGPVVIGAVSRGVPGAPTPCGGGGIYVRTDKIVEWLETTAGKAIAKHACGASPGGESKDDGYADAIGCSTSGGGAGFAIVFALAFVRRGSRRTRSR